MHQWKCAEKMDAKRKDIKSYPLSVNYNSSTSDGFQGRQGSSDYRYNQFIHSDTNRQETWRGNINNNNERSTGVYAVIDRSRKIGSRKLYEKVKKVIYIEVIRAIYGMLQSDILSYTNIRKKLQTDGFKYNPYETFMYNKIIERDQLPIVFHVYDVKKVIRTKR